MNFWADKRVFVTGHTGFKGSWLTMWLARLGSHVVGYSVDVPTRPSLFDMARVGELVDDQRGNICDYSRLVTAIERARPDILIHLAAQPLVRTSYAQPRETFETNLLGTVNVLEALRHSTSVQTVLMVTTDKVYDVAMHNEAHAEDDRLAGRDPYSASKVAAEHAIIAYRASFPGAARIATVRAGNVIGGGDYARDRLVPDAIAAFSTGASVTLRYPDAIRPWQHVLDSLHGYCILAQALHADAKFAQAWNIGPANDSSANVKTVVERLAHGWDVATPWQTEGNQEPHETAVLRLDSRKANRELGFTGRLNVDLACEWTTQWYQEVRAGKDARVLCDEQIKNYEELA